MVRVLAFLLLALRVPADLLDPYIREQLREHRVPGASVAIIWGLGIGVGRQGGWRAGCST